MPEDPIRRLERIRLPEGPVPRQAKIRLPEDGPVLRQGRILPPEDLALRQQRESRGRPRGEDPMEPMRLILLREKYQFHRLKPVTSLNLQQNPAAVSWPV